MYAGGRIKNQVAYIKVQKIMDESFLLQLWKKDGTTASTETIHAAFANRISKYFTPIVLSISMLAGIVWLYLDASRAVEVVVAVLIVACPCAIALSGPFIYGNMVRHFGRMGLLLKNNASIEKIAHTTHWVFDKTGTLTNKEKTKIQYTGSSPLSNDEKKVIRSMAYQSAHPMSKALFLPSALVAAKKKVMRFTLPLTTMLVGLLLILRGLSIGIPYISPAIEDLEIRPQGSQYE